MATVGGGAQPASRKVYDTTLSVAQASLTIPVPAGGKHLRIVCQGRGDTAATATQVNMRCNGDSTAGDYATQYLTGNGAAAAAGEQVSGQAQAQIGSMPAAGAPAANAGQLVATFANYASTSFNHSFQSSSTHLSANASGGFNVQHFGGYWFSAAALTQVTLLPAAGNFVANTSVQAYIDY